jgi:hypothetical protein
MLVSGAWLMLLLADCSTAAQDCPAGQMCTATSAGDSCPERGQCEPLPAAAEIELSLPVAKGERVFCIDGNLRPGRYRVGACWPEHRFSFYLASTAFEAPHVVVASADGHAYFWAGCGTKSLTHSRDPGTLQCNLGRGNYVRIQHTPDVYTEYLHLSAVLVDWGQWVKRGQPIGIEGNTGPAPTKEIRWGAHRGNALDGGPSIPMSRIRLLGSTASSATFKCGDSTRSVSPDAETAYLSDTAPVAPPDPNRFAFFPFKPEDGSALGLLTRLRLNPQDSNSALAQLRALADVGENRYWLGVALQELKKNAEAEELLRLQQGRASLAPIYQQWIDLRLAELATARGANKEARALLEKIRDANDRPDFKQRWETAWARLLAEAK